MVHDSKLPCVNKYVAIGTDPQVTNAAKHDRPSESGRASRSSCKVPFLTRSALAPLELQFSSQVKTSMSARNPRPRKISQWSWSDVQVDVCNRTIVYTGKQSSLFLKKIHSVGRADSATDERRRFEPCSSVDPGRRTSQQYETAL